MATDQTYIDSNGNVFGCRYMYSYSRVLCANISQSTLSNSSHDMELCSCTRKSVCFPKNQTLRRYYSCTVCTSVAIDGYNAAGTIDFSYPVKGTIESHDPESRTFLEVRMFNYFRVRVHVLTTKYFTLWIKICSTSTAIVMHNFVTREVNPSVEPPWYLHGAAVKKSINEMYRAFRPL